MREKIESQEKRDRQRHGEKQKLTLIKSLFLRIHFHIIVPDEFKHLNVRV